MIRAVLGRPVLSGAMALAFVSAGTAGAAALTGAGGAAFAEGGPSASAAAAIAALNASDDAGQATQTHVIDERRSQQTGARTHGLAVLAAMRREAQVRAARNAERKALDSANPQVVARAMLTRFGWGGSQFTCLVSLWNKESKWSTSATNPSSGAYGIPQALPGAKMASAGPDWRTSALTQITWGLGYIQARYGSPCGAWAHSEASGWY